MSQTPAHKPVCSECGSETLGPALFCFHCGARLGSDATETETGAKAGSDLESVDITGKAIAPPPGDPFTATADVGSDLAVEEVALQDENLEPSMDSGMATASTLRKNPGVMRMRRVEVRWASNEGSPNIWFIVASIVLFALVFGVFLLSMILR